MVGSGGETFVGREHELAEFTAGIEDATRGRGRLFLICGDAGIGKTRLVDEFVAGAAARGSRVAWGRCRESGGAPPYWPWIQVIRACLPNASRASLDAPMAAASATVAQIVPEIGEWFPPALQPRAERAALEFGSEEARFRLFDAVAQWLDLLDRQQPTVLVFDDLHAADMPSLLMLEFLAREIHHAHLLLLGTYREVEARSRPAVPRLLAEIGRNGRTIPLRGLSQRDVGRFVEAVSGVVPSAAFVAAIHSQTEGNPFFLDGVVRLLRAEGRMDELARAPESGLRIPEAVREAIRQRVDRLPQLAREALARAAVLGRTFHRTPLQRLAHLSDRELIDSLAAAIAAGVVVETSAALGQYRFSHGLIRDTLYDDLAPAARAEFHRRAGEALESLPPSSTESSLAEVAHHFHQAMQTGQAEKALEYSSRAGEHAMSQLAYEDAASHFERALQAAEQADRVDRRAELSLALGEARRKAGETERAKDAFRQAMHLAALGGSSGTLARAALGYAGRWIEAGVVDQAAVSVLREALAVLEESAGALRATIMGRLAIELYYRSSSRDESEQLTLAAVDMARRSGDPQALAYALHARHVAFWGPDKAEDSIAVGSEIGELAHRAGDSELVLWGRIWRILGLLESAEIGGLDLDIQAMVQQAETLRLPSFLWWTQVFRATRAHLDGRFDDSERIAQNALLLGQRISERNAPQYFGVQLFSIAWDRGRLAELQESVQAMAVQYPAIHSWRAALALIHADAGAAEQATLELDGLAGGDPARLPMDVNWFPTMVVCAEACALLGDATRAAVLYSLLARYPGRIVVVGNAIACRGSTSHDLGILAATMGRWDDAERHLEDALAQHWRMTARPFIARTRIELARVLIARGRRRDRARARSLIELGLAAARQLGMKRVIERALELDEAPIPDQARDPGSRDLESQKEALAAGGMAIAACTTSRGTGTVVALPSRPSRAESAATGGGPAHPIKRTPGGPSSPDTGLFHKEGDYWTLAFEGRVTRLRDAKGLHYIAHLLRHPDTEFHVLDVIAALGAVGATSTSVEGPSDLGDAGEVLDAKARATYRRRLADVREEIEEARARNDLGWIDRLQSEMDFLSRELAVGIGLGGRVRRAGSAAERARINVTRRIGWAVRRIAQADPSLGRYLATTIRTGTFCSYMRDPRIPVRWNL